MDLKSQLNRHYSLLDLDPRIQTSLTNLVLRWVTSSGMVFTIERLKKLKLSLISYLNREKDYLRHCTWFKKTKKGRNRKLSGPFSILFSIERSKRHQIRRSLSIVNTYYLFVVTSKEWREQEERKALELIQEPYKGSSDYPDNFSPFRYTGGEFGIEPNLGGFYTSKPLWGRRRSSSKWFDSIMETSFELLPYQEYLNASPIKDTSQEVSDSWEVPHQHTGDIIFLHENGGKVRPICTPHAEIQVVFQNFHRALNSILGRIREDCTFDQEEGANWASEQLRAGKTVYSIDLKSATDRFPLWLQLKFLEKSGIPKDWLDAFRVTAQAKFKTPYGIIEYGCGQAMGLYGSFPLLALGQHGLVRMAGFLTGQSTKDKYRVLGDDIVISDKVLAEAYYELLAKYDIPVSSHKCITSNRIAEFCGFLITKDSVNKGVKPKGKYENISLLVNYARAIGRIPRVVDKKRRDLLTPLVESPEVNGGLGLNPRGLSFAERDLYFDPLYELDRWRDRTLKGAISIRRYFNQIMHESAHLGNYVFLSKYLDFLDTKIKRLSDQKGIGFLLDANLQLAFLKDPMFIGIKLDSRIDESPSITSDYIRAKYPYYFLT